MRDSRTICLLCRSRLAVSTARRQLPLWTERTRLYTTAQDVAENSPEDYPAVGTSTTPEPRNRNRSVQTSTDVGNTAASARRLPKVRGARSLEIFEEVLLNQQEEGSTPQWQPKVGITMYQHLGKLGAIRKEQQGLAQPDAFEYFREHIYPELRKQNLRSLPPMFIRTARYVLNDAATAKMTDFTSSAWPTVAEITLMRRRLRLMEKPEHWTPMIVALVDCIRNISTSPDEYVTLEEYENSQATRQALLKDLVESWRMFCLPDVQLELEGVLNSPTQFRLPDLNMKMLHGAARVGDISLGLATMFNRYNPSSLQSLPRAAIPTFALLTDPVLCEDAIRRIAKEPLSMMGRIFVCFPVEESQMRKILMADLDLGDYVWDRWQALTKDSKSSSQHADKTLYLNQEQHRHDSRTKTGAHKDPLATGVLKKLATALHARDPKAAEVVWVNLWGKEETPSSERAKKLLGMEEEFNYFIRVFTAMRQNGRAIEVLGCMARIGLAPTLKTWTSFIKGCEQASNAAAIQNIWERLVASGIQLDSWIWASRISGLIQAGAPEAGLRALTEMQKTWNEAVITGKPQTAVQPTIQVVNAAISGLLRINSSSAARKVLTWAGKHGIRPDVMTFNTLLTPLVREGREADISNLLAEMEKQDVQADAATFTILMDGAMARLDAVDSQDRVHAVESILAQMQAAGIEPNIQTYGKMIYILLQYYSDTNEDPVMTLLSHVWANGRQLSPHIYTMLAEHYFSRDPPKLESVDRLVNNCTLPDRIFWERVVKGYARAGDTANALACFQRIENSLSVTMSTLEDLLSALIAKEEWDEARALVSKVKSQRELGGGLPDPEDRFWKHRFWHLARTHELLDN